MRQHVDKARLFDLALAESTRPDGSRETFRYGDKTYDRLTGDYTEDGGT